MTGETGAAERLAAEIFSIAWRVRQVLVEHPVDRDPFPLPEVHRRLAAESAALHDVVARSRCALETITCKHPWAVARHVAEGGHPAAVAD